MHRKIALLVLALGVAPMSPAQADEDGWRDLISTGMTSASTYLTVKDDKLIVAAQDDAGSFVASDGQIRGPYLEAALRQMRQQQPQLQASDMELATAILTTSADAPGQRFAGH